MALQMAMERYGDRITVNGTERFKEQVIHAAAASQLPITFSDPALERRHQIILQETQQHEYFRQRKQQHGRGADRRSDGRARSTSGNRIGTGTGSVEAGRGKPGSSDGATTIAKPNVGRVGRVPPPQSRHRLRELSELGMVRIASGGEVLLPGDVSDHLEQQGTQSDHALRWGVFGSRLKPDQILAAEKYIAEREEKRRKGFDIPKHDPFKELSGVISYAGIRNIEDQVLVLLKRGERVMVLPVNYATAQRLKRLAIGDIVTITEGGSIRRSKTRSR